LGEALRSVVEDIHNHGHRHAGLDAAALIFGSAILATGVTTVVNNLREQKNDSNFSLLDEARLWLYSGLYVGSAVLIMVGHSEVEVDRSYSVARDIDGRPVIIHGGGGMTEQQANDAIKKGFY